MYELKSSPDWPNGLLMWKDYCKTGYEHVGRIYHALTRIMKCSARLPAFCGPQKILFTFRDYQDNPLSTDRVHVSFSSTRLFIKEPLKVTKKLN